MIIKLENSAEINEFSEGSLFKKIKDGRMVNVLASYGREDGGSNPPKGILFLVIPMDRYQAFLISQKSWDFAKISKIFEVRGLIFHRIFPFGTWPPGRDGSTRTDWDDWTWRTCNLAGIRLYIL